MAKQIAATLTNILETPLMRAIQDRTQDVEPLALELLNHWSLDLYTRKPGPAANAYGEFVGTDLDLATFLTALAQRGAVIVIPQYKTMRARTQREGERHIGDKRYGNIIRLYANKEVFSFGVQIKDMSVVSQDQVTGRETAGVPRNFTLLDVTGKWHEGWHHIEFSPSAPENEFLNNRQLWTENTIVFRHFVHPNRWQSFYGNPYFQTKAAIERLTDEAKHLQTEIKRLEAAGVRYPATNPGGPKDWPKSEKVTEDHPVKVNAMEVELDLPEPQGEYRKLDTTETELIAAYDRRKRYVNQLVPQLTFAARSVELAFFQHGWEASTFHRAEVRTEKMPGWIKAEWQREYTPPGRRNKYNRLILFQPVPGQIGVSIRYRIYSKTERLATEER
jgi:hypothetical protein